LWVPFGLLCRALFLTSHSRHALGSPMNGSSPSDGPPFSLERIEAVLTDVMKYSFYFFFFSLLDKCIRFGFLHSENLPELFFPLGKLLISGLHLASRKEWDWLGSISRIGDFFLVPPPDYGSSFFSRESLVCDSFLVRPSVSAYSPAEDKSSGVYPL